MTISFFIVSYRIVRQSGLVSSMRHVQLQTDQPMRTTSHCFDTTQDYTSNDGCVMYMRNESVPRIIINNTLIIFSTAIIKGSLSLVMSECSLSGRGQGHVSNFYIVDLEHFATASRRYTGAIHNSTVIGLLPRDAMHPRY